MLGSVNRGVLQSRFRVIALMHTTAGAVGGVIALMLLRLGADQLGLESGQTTTVAVGLGLLAVAGVFDYRTNSSLARWSGKAVPANWRYSLKPWAWSTAYGGLLGLTLLTRLPMAIVPVGLLLLATVPGSLALMMLSGAVYGLTRTANVLVGKRVIDLITTFSVRLWFGFATVAALSMLAGTTWMS